MRIVYKVNNNNNKRLLTPKSMPPASDEHAKPRPPTPYKVNMVIYIIKDLYSGSRARVTAHGTDSGWFDIRTGVRQGCPLSPLLFNIYMDFLARQVIQECEEAGVRGFKVAYRRRASQPY